MTVFANLSAKFVELVYVTTIPKYYSISRVVKFSAHNCVVNIITYTEAQRTFRVCSHQPPINRRPAFFSQMAGTKLSLVGVYRTVMFH